jgi:SAM-dependent MidA family methyltransferase
MNDMERKIAERIRREGPLTFETFMAMALYDDEHGYYSSGKTRIGREGDFYTSSHLTPVFGATVGRQMEDMWLVLGKPGEFTIVEMGAGEGHFCRDMLEYAKGREFFRSLKYVIVERNPVLKGRQQTLLQGFRDRTSWISSLAEVKDLTGCLFSNELLDAFPVHLLEMEEELREVYVTIGDSGFSEETGPLSTGMIEEYFGGAGIALPRGYKTELNLRIRDWLREVGAAFKEGFILTIDYGYGDRDYYSEDRDRGTLVCYIKHRVNENPLAQAGEHDITAHVNFSSLRRWGEDEGFRALGFCSQASFLLSLGIDEEIARLASDSKDYLFELARIKKLILPQGMGESHSVMIQYKGTRDVTLKGCSISNRLRYL